MSCSMRRRGCPASSCRSISRRIDVPPPAGRCCRWLHQLTCCTSAASRTGTAGHAAPAPAVAPWPLLPMQGCPPRRHCRRSRRRLTAGARTGALPAVPLLPPVAPPTPPPSTTSAAAGAAVAAVMAARFVTTEPHVAASAAICWRYRHSVGRAARTGAGGSAGAGAAAAVTLEPLPDRQPWRPGGCRAEQVGRAAAVTAAGVTAVAAVFAVAAVAAVAAMAGVTRPAAARERARRSEAARRAAEIGLLGSRSCSARQRSRRLRLGLAVPTRERFARDLFSTMPATPAWRLE